MTRLVLLLAVLGAGPLVHAFQGFTFSFGNSDHHLERVAIDLFHAGSESRATAWPPVFFRDGRPDDPMQWAVEYVTLREN